MAASAAAPGCPAGDATGREDDRTLGKLQTEQKHVGYGIQGCYHDYTGVPVLTDVDFFIEEGEVHALVGENGSGKSTLIKILTGALQTRLGTIRMDGEEVRLTTPKAAQSLGVGVVHQDYHLFPELTVAQNIFGVNAAQPRRRWTRTVDRTQVERTVEGLLEELRIEIPSTQKVHQLGPAERKFVEIASAMLLRPRFLILDEPTASLEPSAARAVLDLMGRLREQGVGLAFVSHRLDEIMAVGDRTTVLRDGVAVACVPNAETDEARLADLITGGMDKQEAAKRRDWQPSGDVVLRATDIRVAPGRPQLSFEVERGEIFGLTGLLGAGAETLVRMLGGAQPLDGTLELDGVPGRDQGSPPGEPPGHRLHPGGPQGLRAHQRAEHRAERLAPFASQRLTRRDTPLARDQRPGRGIPRRPLDQGRLGRPADLDALRRQPAEGDAGEVACVGRQGAGHRGADARCRHRREAPGPRPAPGLRRRRAGRSSSPPPTSARCSTSVTGSG